MTKKEIMEVLKQKGISFSKSSTKEQLMALLDEARKPQKDVNPFHGEY